MKKSSSNTVFYVTALGLIADFITISSVILSSKKSEGGLVYLFTDIEISNWHMTFIWVISFFTYLGLLRYYWQTNRDSDCLIAGYQFAK